MWTLALVLGCGGPASPPALPADQQLLLVLGPVAHAWRDLARAEGDPGAAAVQYRALAASLGVVATTDPDTAAWRDLLVAAAERDAAFGEALAAGTSVPMSELGPVSVLRSMHLGKRGAVTANASLLLQDPPWATWDPGTTPWLVTAHLALDAAPPFDVDAHWGGWLPQSANRQAAGMAFAEQGKGPPAAFVARVQRRTGPSPLRGPLGCDLYVDVGGEGGPPSPVGAGLEQALRASELLSKVRAKDLTAARATVAPLVASRDPRCPGPVLFDAGLTGRLLLAAGDGTARAELQRAVDAGQALLSALGGP